MGDELIPVFSQDMNNIPALKGCSQVSSEKILVKSPAVAAGYSSKYRDKAYAE